MTSARAQTVNSHRITVSKLSRLQKLILQEIQTSPHTVRGHIALESLSYMIADKYKPRVTERTRERERLDAFSLPTNRVKGGRGDEVVHVLSPKFKASFYRSLRRLEDRGLIARGLRVYEDQGRQIHFTTIYLTSTPTNDLEEKR